MIRILRVLINLPILIILPKIIFQLILSQLHQYLHPFLLQFTLPIIQLTLDPLIFLNPLRQIMILRPQNTQILLRIILPQIPHPLLLLLLLPRLLLPLLHRLLLILLHPLILYLIRWQLIIRNINQIILILLLLLFNQPKLHRYIFYLLQ